MIAWPILFFNFCTIPWTEDCPIEIKRKSLSFHEFLVFELEAQIFDFSFLLGLQGLAYLKEAAAQLLDLEAENEVVKSCNIAVISKVLANFHTDRIEYFVNLRAILKKSHLLLLLAILCCCSWPRLWGTDFDDAELKLAGIIRVAVSDSYRCLQVKGATLLAKLKEVFFVAQFCETFEPDRACLHSNKLVDLGVEIVWHISHEAPLLSQSLNLKSQYLLR